MPIVRIYKEPIWKSWIAFTKYPIFTPEQCDFIIQSGQTIQAEQAKVNTETGSKQIYKVRDSQIAWLPFDKCAPVYDVLDKTVHSINRNSFGFDGITIGEEAQYTEYSKGGFYNWHADCHFEGSSEPSVRKISMTCMLSDPDEYEGGGFKFNEKGEYKLKKGYAVFFASFIEHKVEEVTKGTRKSLVCWFSGPPFR